MQPNSSRRAFLKTAAAASVGIAALAGGLAEAAHTNPALIQSFGPSKADLSGQSQIIDNFSPTIATYNAPNMAIVAGYFGFAGRAVPQEGGSYLNYQFAGRCITHVTLRGAVYVPTANPYAYVEGKPPYNTQPAFTLVGNVGTSTFALDLTHPYVQDGPKDWYPITIDFGNFPPSTTAIRLFLGGQTQWYWLQIGQAIITVQ